MHETCNGCVTACTAALLQVVMTPVRVLYNMLTSVGGPQLAEGFDSSLKLSSVGHQYPVTFAAVNTAAFASVVALVGHRVIKKVAEW